MWPAAAGALVVLVLGGSIIAIWRADVKKAAREEELRRLAEATGEARERHDKEFGRARGGALARARRNLPKTPTN